MGPFFYAFFMCAWGWRRGSSRAGVPGAACGSIPGGPCLGRRRGACYPLPMGGIFGRPKVGGSPGKTAPLYGLSRQNLPSLYGVFGQNLGFIWAFRSKLGLYMGRSVKICPFFYVVSRQNLTICLFSSKLGCYMGFSGKIKLWFIA